MEGILATLAWTVAAIFAAAAAYKIGEVTFPRIGHWATKLRAQAEFERTGSLQRLVDVRDTAAL